MQHDIFVVDAFADRPFTGNPAAVCLCDTRWDDDWMQAVAAEMNLSETAFLTPRDNAEWDLRWFTPKMEVDLCGHATLASAHVLWREIGIDTEALRFHTRSGVLTALRDADVICLDFPADPPAPVATSDELAGILGAEVRSVARGRNKLMAELVGADAVRSLVPNLDAVCSLDAQGVIVTAASDLPEYDFISRFFAPRAGIPEDPVTGAAHCTLGPYWADRLGKATLRGFQASARGGSVGVRLRGGRIELSGKALTTLTGRLCE